MSGQRRMRLGGEHEERVANELRAREWHVEPFGQGLFSEHVRAALQDKSPPTLLRWLPDLIAVKVENKRQRIVLVDAKSAESNTPNHAIEIAAYIAATHTQLLWQIHVVYIFSDMTCNIASELQPVRWQENRTQTRGSGTPYMLVRKADQFSLDKWFGAKASAQEQAA